jgi:conjugal transfer pilus assembly protein TraW
MGLQFQDRTSQYLAHVIEALGTLGEAGDALRAAGRPTIKRWGGVPGPLERVVLQNGLIFIDGTDQAQINYAVQRANTEHLRIVLTKGSPYELRIKYKNTPFRGGKSIPFYFDQDGAIIKTLHLTYALDILSVPTTLTQRGTKLFVETGVRS